MAESFTSYSVDNDRRFRQALAIAAANVADLSVPFGLILQDFYKSEKAIFSLKSPGKYPDYKDGPDGRYARLKQKNVGFEYPLLVASGRLSASVTSSNTSDSIGRVNPRSLEIGTTVPYGGVHQYGSAKKNIAMRKFLFIGPEGNAPDGDELAGRATRWLSILKDATLRATMKAGIGKLA